MHIAQENIVSVIKLHVLVATNLFRQDKEVVRYAAQCFYERKYKNFWILNIVFTKLLSANIKVFYKYTMQVTYSSI